MAKKTKNKFRPSSPLQPIVLALIIVLAIVVSLSYKYYLSDSENFYESILVEAHGTVLDILIFGLLFTFINSLRSRRLEIQRFKEEIDDFRHWNEPGASYRIAGILRRLNKYNIHELDLSHCNLSNAKLKNIILHNANLEKSNMEGAELAFSELQGSNMKAANLIKTDLRIADAQNVDLKMADMRGATLRITNLKGANLFNVNLQNADMKTANLDETDLTTANMTNVDLKSASLINADLSGSNLRGADLRSAKLTGANMRDVNLENVMLGDYISLLEEEGHSTSKDAVMNLYQLGEVASLIDAIMPDGTRFNDEWQRRIQTDFEKYKMSIKK